MGDLTVARGQSAGQSSVDNGYNAGGSTPSSVDVIDKFPFASDSNATDVGDLTEATRLVTGQQN